MLYEVITQNKLQTKLSEVDIVGSWERLMGKTVASYTEDIRITNGTLFIKLKSPILKNELIMMREQIKKHLNEESGAEVIKQIVFQ